jgi:hypothetical protein
MDRIAAVIALTLLPTALPAQSLPLKLAPTPTETAVTAADLMTRLYIFADDSMQGREAGTAGHLRGADYIARELARLGLEPAGENGTFFQDFPLEVTRLAADARVLDGAGTALDASHYLIMPPGPLPLIGAAFQAENATLVFGGRLGQPGLLPPEAAAGKLVLFVPGTDGPDAWQFWSQLGPQVYQRYTSARGLLFASLEAIPANLRDYLGSPQIGMPNPLAPPATLPVMWVSREAAQRLLGGSVDRALPGTPGRAPVTIVAGHERVPTDAPARNVVAMVRGSDPALRGKYVALGAHSDHDGIRPPAQDHDSLRAFNTVVRPNGAEDAEKEPTPAQMDTVRALIDSLRALRPARADSIMNGADDDGTGSMAMLELAEYFMAHPTRRSLLFVWHTAEEKGLFGARHFTDNPTVPRDSIVANLNMDMIGRGGADDLTGGGPGYLQLIGSRRLSTQLGNLVEEVNRAGNHGFTFDYQYDADGHPQQYYCRSDHYMYARHGIPVVFFTTGSHRDYHMLTDEPQYIDYDKYARVTRFIGAVSQAIADLDARPVVDGPRPDPQGQCRQ